MNKPSFVSVCSILLALVTLSVVFGQDKKPVESVTVPSPKLVISELSKLSDITVPAYDSMIVFDNRNNAEALRVTGLTAIELGNPSPYQGLRYGRPEKTEEVVAYLWTKDGRKWRATWVEVKP